MWWIICNYFEISLQLPRSTFWRLSDQILYYVICSMSSVGMCVCVCLCEYMFFAENSMATAPVCPLSSLPNKSLLLDWILLLSNNQELLAAKQFSNFSTRIFNLHCSLHWGKKNLQLHFNYMQQIIATGWQLDCISDASRVRVMMLNQLLFIYLSIRLSKNH